MSGSRRGFLVKASAVQDALGHLIGDEVEAAHEATPVCVGYPIRGLEAEHIWVSGEFDADMPRYVSGGFQRDETGEVKVRISVLRSDADMSAPRDRALELAEIVEDAVSLDPTLGGVVEEAHVSGASGNEAIPDEHSRQYGLVLRVAYQTTAVLS